MLYVKKGYRKCHWISEEFNSSFHFDLAVLLHYFMVAQPAIIWASCPHALSFVSTHQVSKAAADLMAYCDAHIREDPLIMPVPASENPFREKKFFCTILWWTCLRSRSRARARRRLASLSSPHLKLLATGSWVEFCQVDTLLFGQLCPGGWRFWGSQQPNWQPSERIMSC